MSLHALDRRINHIAGRQFGVISARQLRRLGVSRAAIRRRVAAGLMRVVLARVYAVGPASAHLTDDGLRMAAVLSGGIGSALCGPSAAARRGLWRRSVSGIHVLAPSRRSHVPYLGIRYHESVFVRGSEIELVDGIPTLSVTATCATLGMFLTRWQVASVLHEAFFLGVLDLDAIERLLDLHRGAPWTAVVRRAIELHGGGSAGTRSASEDHALAGMLRRGYPEPLVNVRNATEVVGFEPDFAWPDLRVVVEIDGGGHDQPGMPENDAEIDAALRAHGWRILRIPASEVWRHHQRSLDAIGALLGVHA